MNSPKEIERKQVNSLLQAHYIELLYKDGLITREIYYKAKKLAKEGDQ